MKQTIPAIRAGMMRGKKFSPQEIKWYENEVRQGYNDTKVEVMMLFFAEILHDKLGFGAKRTASTLRGVDESMTEWIDDGFDIMNLRKRVFAKTGFMFALNQEDKEQIEKALTEDGYNVRVMD